MDQRHTLSEKGQALVNTPLRDDFELFFQAEEHPYHPLHAPNGAISLCVAENGLSWPILEEKLIEIASRPIPQWVSKYTDVKGAPPFREALASFGESQITTLGQRSPRKLDPEGFCVASGATGVIELAAMLLADPGDVAAFPAPCYPVYKQDIGHKALLQRYDIQCEQGWANTNGVHPLALEDLTRSFNELKAEGKRMRMLVLTQPDNPTGSIYSLEQLETFADWCIANQVHLCVNELYALSQINSSDIRIASDYAGNTTPYFSFLNMIEDRQNPYLHWWYSFSKDFGISGFRVGVMYTQNTSLRQAFGNFGAPHTVSNHTQWMLTEMLNDLSWVEAFAKTNQERLTDSYTTVTKALKANDIAYIPARGSLFVWAKLNTVDSTSDQAYWKTCYDQHQVLLTSPTGFGQTEKGWMRIVYSSVSQKALQVAFERMYP